MLHQQQLRPFTLQKHLSWVGASHCAELVLTVGPVILHSRTIAQFPRCVLVSLLSVFFKVSGCETLFLNESLVAAHTVQLLT